MTTHAKWRHSEMFAPVHSLPEAEPCYDLEWMSVSVYISIYDHFTYVNWKSINMSYNMIKNCLGKP